jgi:hypothetical protein
MRYAITSAFVLCALVAQAVPQETAKRKIPCKTPENAAMCYWTHGRLALCNGNPSFRVWKVGTKRILSVLSGPNSWARDPEDGEHPEFPANLERAYAADYKWQVQANAKGDIPAAGWPDPVFADFEICPLEPEHPGWMQSVCIESAKSIFVQKGTYVPRY